MAKRALLFATILLAGFPLAVFAQGPTITPVPGGGVLGILNNLKNVVLGILWMIAVTFTIFMFVQAGFHYMTAKGDPTKIREGHHSVVWASLGAAIIVLAWSIINIVKLQFGL